MNYLESRQYIDELNKMGIRPGTEAIRELLVRLGNPQDKLNIIHVAGTNGKGSICSYLEYGLRECGLKIARYISPALFEYLERFQIDGEIVSEKDFSEAISEIKEKCDEMVLDGLPHLTAFEVETVASFLISVKNQADVMILETGMGGEEDATNVVKKPLATVFASISYDHKRFLGETIEEIAETKAGIMREDVPVIVSHMPEVIQNGIQVTAYETIQNEADKRGASIYSADNINDYDEDFLIDNKNNILYRGKAIKNPLRGSFQLYNMQTAITVFSVVKNDLIKRFPEKNISSENFVIGIKKTRWPGRYETISSSPLIIRDGAHNPDAIRLLKESILSDERITGKVHMIMGVYADKEYDDMIKDILPLAKSFTAITPPNPARALPKEELYNVVIKIINAMKLKDLDIIPKEMVSCKENLNDAINSLYLEKDDTVIVFGSLSLASLFEDK